MVKLATVLLAMLSEILRVKALSTVVEALIAKEGIVIVLLVMVIPAVRQDKTQLTLVAVAEPTLVKVTSKNPDSLYSGISLLSSS